MNRPLYGETCQVCGLRATYYLITKSEIICLDCVKYGPPKDESDED